eukprot:13391-Heterococcus_DN1.PRE.2
MNAKLSSSLLRAAQNRSGSALSLVAHVTLVIAESCFHFNAVLAAPDQIDLLYATTVAAIAQNTSSQGSDLRAE